MGQVRVLYTAPMLPHLLGLPPDSTITAVTCEGAHLIVHAKGPNIPDFDLTKDVFWAPNFELRWIGSGYEMWAYWHNTAHEAWRVFPSDEMVRALPPIPVDEEAAALAADGQRFRAMLAKPYLLQEAMIRAELAVWSEDKTAARGTDIRALIDAHTKAETR